MKRFLILATCCFAVFYFYSLHISSYWVDHGYYVSVSKCMAEGMIPWKDFQLIYTPLGTFFMAIPFIVGGTALSSAWAQAVFFLFILGTAVLLYFILSELAIKSTTKWLSILYYLLLCYSSETLSIELEPFAVFWCLSGFLFLLKFANRKKSKYLYAAGICCTLSFLSKQYGVISLGVFILMLSLGEGSQKQKIRQIFTVCLSSFASVMLCYIFTGCAIHDFSFYKELTGSDYPSRPQTLFAYGFNYFFLKACLFTVALPFVYSTFHDRAKKITIVSIAGILLFSLQFYVRQYVHYCLFMYPFVAILFAYVWEAISKKWLYLIPLSSFVCASICCYMDYSRLNHGLEKKMQASLFQEVKQLLPVPTKTIVGIMGCGQGPQFFSEIKNLKPVDYHCNKYGFDSYEYPKRVFALYPKAECMIVDDRYLSFAYRLDSAVVSRQLKRMQLIKTLDTYKIKIYKTPQQTEAESPF